MLAPAIRHTAVYTVRWRSNGLRFLTLCDIDAFEIWTLYRWKIPAKQLPPLKINLIKLIIKVIF